MNVLARALAVLAFGTSLGAHAGQFTMTDIAGVRGESLVVAVRFAGDPTSVDAQFDLSFNGMYLAATAARGANGGDCAILPGFQPNTVRVLAPPYTGQPLAAAPTDICYVTIRVEPSPQSNALFGINELCVTDGLIPTTCNSATAQFTLQKLDVTPPEDSTLAFAGAAGATSATRTVQVRNTDLGVSYDVSCSTGAAVEFSVSPPSANIAAGTSVDFTFQCNLPPANTTVIGTANCTTSDASQPTLAYRLVCRGPDPPNTPRPENPLTAETGDAADTFGTAVAVVELPNGLEIAVVGAPDASDGGGSAYVYERPPGGAYDEKALRATKPAAVLRPHRKSLGDKFGQTVAVSADGTLIAVGAPSGGSGSVLVFERPGGNWSAPNSLPPVSISAPSPSGGITPSGFGASLAFGTDNSLAIGANKSGVGGTVGAGSAHLYTVGGGSASPLGASLAPSAPQTNGGFGSAIARTSGFLAVGAPGEGSQAGALYAYQTTPAGVSGAGSRTTRAGGAIGDKWGTSVAVNSGFVVVGAPSAASGGDAGAGIATVLTRGPGTTLDEASTLRPEPGANQGAGSAVAMNDAVVVIGAPLATVAGQPERGRAYLFQLDALLLDAPPAATLDRPGGAGGDRFGSSTTLARRALLIGAPFADDTVGAIQMDAGSVDLFLLDGIYRNSFE